MEKNKENRFVKWVDKEINVIDNVTVVREDLQNGYEFLTLKVGENVLCSVFNNPKRQRNKEPPKHTGGKKPYLMLMVEKIQELRDTDLPNVEELVGFMVCLGDCIEWSTGRLIHKRGKKPLQYQDLLNRTGSKWKLDRILKQLKEQDLLYKTAEGYFISRSIIKKGGR